jgi:CobQ-like glutamine amidotransferase family enzyme
MTGRRPAGVLRIAHLFPDLLNVYGDAGNVRTLVARTRTRGIRTEVVEVRYAAPTIPVADLYLIGGGQDREQLTVATELERLGAELAGRLEEGVLLAVCGGYQNLGRRIVTPTDELAGPAILPAWTDVRPRAQRLVGPIVISAPASVAALGAIGARQAGVAGAETTIVGFENHGGRTFLESGARPLGRVVQGFGNNGRDGGEGVDACPGSDGLPRRVGTYLHGPLLPRNPHLADALIATSLGRGGPTPELRPLDDRLEWQAHEEFARRVHDRAAAERRLPGWAHTLVDPVRSLIGF